MTAAAKELTKKALALSEKERLDLCKRLTKSLESPARKAKAISGARTVADQTAVYGRNKSPKRVKAVIPKAEVLSKKEWNEAWKGELEKRIEEIDSGKVKCIPHAEVRRELDRILGKS